MNYFKTRKDQIDLVEETITPVDGTHRTKLIHGELYYLSGTSTTDPDGGWFRAPKWAQQYYDQVRIELSDNDCKVCGHQVQMIVMSGTGYCSLNCQDIYDSAALESIGR